MTQLATLKEQLLAQFDSKIQSIVHTSFHELTIEVAAEEILSVCETLRDHPDFKFEMLMDLCGVDYLHYGITEWETAQSTSHGFDRGVQSIRDTLKSSWRKPRFAVVYHLLSISHNHRMRVKTYVPDSDPMLDSVIAVWPNANWYEREAFDLFGILFKGHPDLRRILTDYGFIGHPFRKDFPVEGTVEVRYDAKAQRVVYDAVDIVPRTLVPKVIRKANEEASRDEVKR